jgi:hypothetical protein
MLVLVHCPCYWVVVNCDALNVDLHFTDVYSDSFLDCCVISCFRRLAIWFFTLLCGRYSDFKFLQARKDHLSSNLHLVAHRVHSLFFLALSQKGSCARACRLRRGQTWNLFGGSKDYAILMQLQLYFMCHTQTCMPTPWKLWKPHDNSSCETVSLLLSSTICPSYCIFNRPIAYDENYLDI